MITVLRYFQRFPRVRWQRLGDEQLTVISLIVAAVYVALGLQLLVAWVRIKLTRTFHASNDVRAVLSVPKRPREAAPSTASKVTG